MSKKKIILVISLLMIIIGIFAFGALSDDEITLNFEAFKEDTSTVAGTFKLIKFSTEDYPTIRAYFYLATTETQPNFKVTDGNIDKNAEHIATTINGVYEKDVIASSDFKVKGYKDKETKNGIDYYYYLVSIQYNVSTVSTATRNANFYIVNGEKINGSNPDIFIKNYEIAEVEVEARFTNPNRGTRQLEKKDSKIILSGKAYTRTKRGVYYPTTGETTKTILTTNLNSNKTGMTFEPTGTPTPIEDPIVKGNFIVDSSDPKDIMDGVVGDSYVEGSTTWYPVTLEMSASAPNTTVKDVYASLLSNPTGHSMKFTAISKSKLEGYDLLSDVTVVEGDPPKITSLTLSNTTLAKFMDELKGTENTQIFSGYDNDLSKWTGSIKTYAQKSISNLSGLTANDLASMGNLNVKNKDDVELVFTIDDESVGGTDSTKGIIEVTVNGQTFSTANTTGNTIKTTRVGDVTTAELTYKYDNTKAADVRDKITFNVIDGSQIKNSSSPTKTGNITTLEGTVFNEPSLIKNTEFSPRVGNPASDTTNDYSNYYNDGTDADHRGEIQTKDNNSGVLAYLVCTDYNKDNVDSDIASVPYPNGTNYVVANTNNEFGFADGMYSNNGTVYVLNMAGALYRMDNMSTLAESTLSNLSSALQKENNSNIKFYVDTVAPKVSNFVFEKLHDANSVIENNSFARNIVVGDGIISSLRPFKVGDTISTAATIAEKNLAKLNFLNSSNTAESIFSDSTLGTLTGSSYSKSSEAVDLTPSESKEKTLLLTANVYDKAGNIQNKDTSNNFLIVNAVYDDREPSSLVTLATIPVDITKGNNYKYTSNSALPLEKYIVDTNNPPLSVAFVTKGSNSYVGDVRNASSSNINLTSFTGFPSVPNSENSIKMSTYSTSGQVGEEADSIVLDTEVNGGTGIVNENYTTSGSYNVFNLNSLLDNVTELVGLKSFIVTKSGTGSDAKVSDNGTEKSLGTVISLDAYSGYNEIITRTVYSTLSTPRNYKLLIPKGITGKMNYKINLKDRLGNSKDVIYTVIITGKTNIIGTSKNSKMKITTTISNGSEMKIQARTE